MAYKRQKRSNIMLCYPFEERRLLEPKFGWSWPVIVQPKLDGERCHNIAHILPDICLISSECNQILSVPHINQAMIDQKVNVELDGELYIHGMEFNDIHSIVSRKSYETLHDDAYKMKFHVFDIASEDQQLVRMNRLFDLNLQDPLIPVKCYIASDMDQLMKYYFMILDDGYEGIVIRHLDNRYERKRSRFIMKFKPKKADDYEIIDVIEAVDKDGNPKGMVGAFECIGVDETPFKVGAGALKHDERYAFWRLHSKYDDVRGRICRVQYQSIFPGTERPRFGLALEVFE